ncbi:MAG: HTTM domain-containing protein [Planctomycetota bacterium]
MRSDTRLSFSTRVNHFFFAQQSPYGLALVRMFLISVALIPMVRRFPRVRELFSSDGAPQQLAEFFGQGTPFPELAAPVASALYGVMLFALFSAVFGFRTRLALLIGTPLYIYFNELDAVSTMTKYSVITAHALIMLTVSECGAVWSVDAILRRWREGSKATAIPRVFSVWPARMIQMLFCFVYFGAAITKIQTNTFFSGEQMRYWMLSNWNYPNPIGEWIATSTPVLLACGYLTVVWEITFPFLAWRPAGRFFALGFGAIFHIMTLVTLGLYIFPFICISCYLSFLMEEDIVAIRRFVHRLRFPTAILGTPRFLVARLVESRPAILSPGVLFACLLLTAAVVSAEADYRFDLYGYRANNGPLPLEHIDRSEALAIINSQRPLRDKDKFFSFGVGNLMVGGQLANHREHFRYGEAIVAQCNVNTPHEDMWVECVLQDEQDRIIDTSGQYVTREMMYANFNYQTCRKLVPGRYWMVLRCGGKEIARRPFQLQGDGGEQCETGSALTN